MRRRSVRFVTAGLAVILLLGACGQTSGEDGVAEITEADAAPTDTATPIPEPASPPTPTAVAAGESASDSAQDNDGLFPTVVDARASTSDGASWRFDVTLLSEYDSPARYADAWRVLDADDNELGIRVLGHDHANEQPFTRSTTVEIPAGTTTVFVEGRDQLNGWSGERFELKLSP